MPSSVLFIISIDIRKAKKDYNVPKTSLIIEEPHIKQSLADKFLIFGHKKVASRWFTVWVQKLTELKYVSLTRSQYKKTYP